MTGSQSRKINWPLLANIGILLVLGLVILVSVSSVVSESRFGEPTRFFNHQIVSALLPGIILGLAAFFLPLEFFKKWSLACVVASMILMVLVFVPKLGLSLGGAARWLNLGLFSVQPSEFLKLGFLIYLSAWMANRTEKKRDKKSPAKFTLLPFIMILVFVTVLLALQSDLGTLGVVGVMALAIYFSSRMPLWHFIFILGLMGSAAGVLIKIEPYRFKRFAVFLNPNLDAMGIGYQVKQALIAIGSGGIMGLGLGDSQQKLGFLPQAISDSIFAVYAEELGFLGCFILVVMFITLFWLGIKIAKASQDSFSQFFAIGFVSWLLIQAFVNIGAMSGLLPLTGIPLPFISYGGSHLIVELIGAGILLNISKNNHR